MWGVLRKAPVHGAFLIQEGGSSELNALDSEVWSAFGLEGCMNLLYTSCDMKKNTPHTTLFMISSLDGKISSGDSDSLDVDQDWKRISGVKEGLHQYYDLEKRTDLVSFNTGRVMAKVGVNKRQKSLDTIPVRFVLVDNKPHLNKKGLEYLTSWLKHVYIVTTNKKHPAYKMSSSCDNLTVISYPRKIDFTDLFKQLKGDFGVNRMTIQSGGTMNAVLLRAGLIDRVSVVLAPLLVGGDTTSTLVDGAALHRVAELNKIKAMKLLKVDKLKHSYIHALYRVIQDTKIGK